MFFYLENKIWRFFGQALSSKDKKAVQKRKGKEVHIKTDIEGNNPGPCSDKQQWRQCRKTTVSISSSLRILQLEPGPGRATVFDDYSIPPKRVGENNAPRTCVRSVAGAY